MFSHEGLSRELFSFVLSLIALVPETSFEHDLDRYFAPVSQVDEDAFTALEECIASGDFDVCEDVPAGDTGSLANPIAAFAVDMAGPARYETELNGMGWSPA